MEQNEKSEPGTNQFAFYIAAMRLFYPVEGRIDLCLLKITGTDAGGAESDSFDGAVVIDFDRLQVEFESTFGVFHHMHTDTASFLGQTFTGDVTTIGFDLAAHCTDFAHFSLATIDNFSFTK